MIRAQNLLVAQTVLIDAQTNSASIIAMLEEIRVATFPVVAPPFHVLAVLERDPVDGGVIEARVVVDLDGREIAVIPMHIDFQGARKTRGVIRIEGFLVPGPGRLCFRVMHAGRELASYAIEVHPIRAGLGVPLLPPNRPVN